MTKKQELSILDDTITVLGPDSYLGPWLSRVRDEVAGNMRCDIFPEILPTKESLAYFNSQLATDEPVESGFLTREQFRKKYNQLDLPLA